VIQDPGSLANLRDVIPPEPAAAWPPAPGWIGISVAVASFAVWFSLRARARWRADRYRRAALSALEDARARGAVRELPELLRRVALAAYPRREVASPIGNEWLDLLDRAAPGRIDADVGRDYLALAYDPDARIDASRHAALFDAAQAWIRHHAEGAPC
jgi:hypothetical protein